MAKKSKSAKQQKAQNAAKERMKLAKKILVAGGTKTTTKKVHKLKMSDCLKKASKQLRNKQLKMF